MSKWKRFTTSTGSTYEVVDEDRWRKNEGWFEKLWEFAAVPPWEDNRSEVVRQGLIEWSRKNGDMMRWPGEGECLFIMSRDVWWLSTPIVNIEEWEEDGKKASMFLWNKSDSAFRASQGNPHQMTVAEAIEAAGGTTPTVEGWG